MTIVEYRRRLGWSQRELSRRAQLDPNTVRKAESGQAVSSQTALAIAQAFSGAFGRRILVEDIEGLDVVP
jgi:ribosome-binding protein aMBF1 (putative translation factor)